MSDIRKSEIIIYQTEDGHVALEVLLQNDSVWLSLNQMSDLFQRDKSVISRHISNVYSEGELPRDGTVAKIATVQIEGNRRVERDIDFFNLDVIISVGYRVRSFQGTQFRIWATQRLKEYLVKGFVLDDQRLKEGGYQNKYFNELLERIRDIRTSEKNFYYKIREIYTLSADYDPQDERTQQFFATIQNKFHWAIHNHTAAELIAERADSHKPNMGLTTWSGEKVRKKDIKVAKNYLYLDELKQLNLLVEQFLAFAESQAEQRKVMYMRDWIKKLNDILIINDREVLESSGKISREEALQHALSEYDIFRNLLDKIGTQNLKELESKTKQINKKSRKDKGNDSDN